LISKDFLLGKTAIKTRKSKAKKSQIQTKTVFCLDYPSKIGRCEPGPQLSNNQKTSISL
jgi:hypothetical protein